MADRKELLTGLSGASTEGEGLRSTTGDAVPEPLAFCALGQQHNKETRRCYRGDGIAHATAHPGYCRRSSEARNKLAAILMPLAQSEKCRGLGQSPKRLVAPGIRIGRVRTEVEAGQIKNDGIR